MDLPPPAAGLELPFLPCPFWPLPFFALAAAVPAACGLRTAALSASALSVRYGSDDRPLALDAIVVSTQHSEDVAYKTLKEAVMDEVVKPILPS